MIMDIDESIEEMLLMKQMRTQKNPNLLQGLSKPKSPSQEKQHYKIEVESMINTQNTNSSSSSEEAHTFHIKNMKS